MKLFDSHCHLNDKSYDNDLDEVIKHAHEANVDALMIVGITEKTSIQAVSIAESRPGLYASVGIHPHDAKDCTQAALDVLKKLAKNPKVRAWGETGLDFNRMYSSQESQEKWFIRQIEIADELELPLIFHERESHGRFLEILKVHHKKGRKGVVHCFSGNKKELEQYLELGLYIGITGILTIKSRGAYLRELVPFIPTERILIETDAPYLTPAPEKNRTRRNEPAFVKSVLIKLAKERGEDPEFLSAALWDNTCRLFDIDNVF